MSYFGDILDCLS